MAKKGKVCAIDLGSTKIACALAEYTEDSKINILGYGSAKPEGFQHGVVVDIEKASASLYQAIQEAENNAGSKIKKFMVRVGIFGEHIKEVPGESGLNVKNPKRVTEDDVLSVKESAQTIKLHPDSLVLHLIPLSYSLDELSFIKKPEDMSGYKLKLKALLLIAQRTAIQSISRVLNSLDIRRFSFLFSPIATGLAVSSDEERDMGVAVLDIGGMTKFSIFSQGEYQRGFSIPYGGVAITNDISMVLTTPFSYAEKIKKEKGVALLELIEKDSAIDILDGSGVSRRKSTLSQLAQIIKARLKEIFLMVREKGVLAEYKDKLSAGIILAGGVANTKGIAQIAEELFGLPARVGYNEEKNEKIYPQEFLSPNYATIIGLIESRMKGMDYSPVQSADFFDKLAKGIKKIFKPLTEAE